MRESRRATALRVHDARVIGVDELAARAVILATGGAAALWSRTTNPPGSFGSGLLLARAAGATLADLEFVQFHPTAVTGVPGREGFLATEAWGNDNVSFPGACYERYIDALYRKNRLVAGEFTVLGRAAKLGHITCHVLAIAFTDDHIVPVPCAQPLIDLVGSRDKQILVDRGGHVGAVVSRKAAQRLWPALSTFWAQRD